MVSPQALLVMLAALAAFYGAQETVRGVKKASHAISRRFRHHKVPVDPAVQNDQQK